LHEVLRAVTARKLQDVTMKTIKLPRWVNDVLGSCPKAGKGVHHWLFVTALKLHPEFPDKDDLELVLDMATRNCGREVTAMEIEDAVRDSQRVIENPTGPTQRSPSCGR